MFRGVASTHCADLTSRVAHAQEEHHVYLAVAEHLRRSRIRWQRLGRLLRPKQDGRTAQFYTLIARDTLEQDFAQNRQRFLAEQGYSYEILDSDSI